MPITRLKMAQAILPGTKHWANRLTLRPSLRASTELMGIRIRADACSAAICVRDRACFLFVECLWPLTVPEGKLLDAVLSGSRCEFLQVVVSKEAARNGSNGTDQARIRADVLKVLLSDDARAWGIQRDSAVHLVGAVISGDLSGLQNSLLPPMQLEGCTFDNADLSAATFTGDTSFQKTIFGGITSFQNASFAGVASFQNASFASTVSFTEAKFEKDARFLGATFIDAVEFNRSHIKGEARFADALFAKTARFNGAIFAGEAAFNEVYFCGRVRFDGAMFEAAAAFDGATFTAKSVTGKDDDDPVSFCEANFAGPVTFQDAIAHQLSFKSAIFSARNPGPLIASSISLDQAVLTVRSHLSVAALEITACGLQAREGAHLELHCPSVDFSESEFWRRSIVTNRLVKHQIPMRNSGQHHSAESLTDIHARAVNAGNDLRDELVSRFADWRISSAGVSRTYRDQEEARLRVNDAIRFLPRTRITSLRKANVSELVLSDIVLDDCKFFGALGLDKLRIGPGCTFRRTQWSFSLRRLVPRRIIAEEIEWRDVHARGANNSAVDFLPALSIADIYRDLRKSVEEAKNEPGASDFYYGEMEMRRLSSRKPIGGGAAIRGALPSRAERALLNLYWGLSGYGLRPTRALITYAIMIAVAAFLYTSPIFATETPKAPQIAAVDLSTGTVRYKTSCSSSDSPAGVTGNPSERPCPSVRFWDALNYSARESISLLQVRGAPTLDTTTAGTVLDFFLRLAGPVLLAFTVLALRARIKR